jgi:hypothetical protein
MSRYFLVIVLVAFGWVVNGAAQAKPTDMPVVDCVVEYTHGDLGRGYDRPPQISDTISLDLNAVDKISLDFESKQSGSSHIPHGRFRVLGVINSLVDRDAYSVRMNLVSFGPDRKVTIYINSSAYPAGQRPEYFTITMITETSRSIGVVVLKGTPRDTGRERESD